MNTTVISLRPKKEQLVEGFKYFMQVYFRINIPGYDPSACTHTPEQQQKVDAYYQVCSTVFLSLGWELKQFAPDRGICPTYCKGTREMYCHPLSVSGAASAEEIAQIEQLLSAADCFTLYNTDITGYVYDITEAEIPALLSAKYPDIDKQIEAATVTKRSNLYKGKFDVVYRISEDMYVKTTARNMCYDIERNFVTERIDALIAAGKLKTGTSSVHGDLIRWYNKKEQQQMQKQQQRVYQPVQQSLF